jgi:hypothetical protein
VIIASTDGGEHWHQQGAPAGSRYLLGISCWTATRVRRRRLARLNGHRGVDHRWWEALELRDAARRHLRSRTALVLDQWSLRGHGDDRVGRATSAYTRVKLNAHGFRTGLGSGPSAPAFQTARVATSPLARREEGVGKGSAGDRYALPATDHEQTRRLPTGEHRSCLTAAAGAARALERPA